ncbi:MAG: cytochrome c [Gammaproteobacteria bacterium]|nr:cytochrome c [Gammaproteobacteria bacterium]
MKNRVVGTIALLAAVFGPFAIQASEVDPVAAERGREHFKLFCTNCHGLSGEGNGPLVAMLKIQPANLTQLARQDGGHFDAERVLKAIDGRHQVGAEGERNMPVFSENLAISTVIDLVEYLKTIQR